jgi:hypothetical protein
MPQQTLYLLLTLSFIIVLLGHVRFSYKKDSKSHLGERHGPAFSSQFRVCCRSGSLRSPSLPRMPVSYRIYRKEFTLIHADLKTTMKYYCEVTRDQRVQAAQKIDDLLEETDVQVTYEGNIGQNQN